MMHRSPLHLVREGDVLETYENAYGFFEVASELWQLAGRADRAKQVKDVVTSAYQLDPPQLDEPRIVELRALLGELEPALVGTLTDEQYLLSREQVEQLRATSRTLDFDESYGVDARRAIQHALIYVDNLRDILDEARAKQASILFD